MQAAIEAAGYATLNVGYASRSKPLEALAEDIHPAQVSVENTKLDGMADHVIVGTSHPWLVRNGPAIAQIIAFLRDGKFRRS